MDEDRRLTRWQIALYGVALVIAGPVVAVRFAPEPVYVTLGLVAGVAGVAMLVWAYLRYRSPRA